MTFRSFLLNVQIVNRFHPAGYIDMPGTAAGTLMAHVGGIEMVYPQYHGDISWGFFSVVSGCKTKRPLFSLELVPKPG
jgi:hypothetical protein